jgi:hypothetical protein
MNTRRKMRHRTKRIIDCRELIRTVVLPYSWICSMFQLIGSKPDEGAFMNGSFCKITAS